MLQKLDEDSEKGYWLGRLGANGKTTDRVLGFEGNGVLKGLVRVEVGAIGTLCPLPLLVF